MSVLSPEAKAALLLKNLPAGTAEKVLSILDAERGARLRKTMQQLDQTPPPPGELDRLLREFNRLLNEPAKESRPAPAGAQHATPHPQKAAAAYIAPEPKPRKPPPPPIALEDDEPEGDPMELLRGLPAEKLAEALESDQSRTIALVLGYLDGSYAGEVLKRLPPAKRREVTLRMGQPPAGGVELAQQIAHTLFRKVRRMAVSPTDQRGDARFRKIADMLRLLERADRTEILVALEEQDASTAAFVKEYLYRFEDLRVIEDRSMQKLLGEIESKSLALALSNAPEDIKTKVMNNLSKRARESLTEEMEFLGVVPASQVLQAQKLVVAVIQKLDVAGELVMQT